MARRRKDPRHRAREAALQILYQWEIGGRDIEKTADTYFTLQWPDREEPPDELRAFASALTLDTVELLRDPATPAAVVINEALELARTFTTEESVKFINGMLDAIRKKIDAVRDTKGTKDTKVRKT